MTTKIKTTLLTGFFFFALLTGLQAQDKYEFAILANNNGKIEFTSKEGSKDVGISNNESSTVAALKKLNDLSNEGWEVYNSETIIFNSVNRMIYYLKRKQNN